MPDRNQEEEDLKRITAEFYLTRSPFKLDHLDGDWRATLRSLHDDTLYYLQKLRPLFMTEAPDKVTVLPPMADEEDMEVVPVDDGETIIFEDRIRRVVTLVGGRNDIIFHVPPTMRNLVTARLLVGGMGSFDYQNKLPDHASDEGYVRYIARIKGHNRGSYRLSVHNNDPKNYHLTFDITFSGGQKEYLVSMAPAEFDSLEVACPVCAAEPGSLCATANDIPMQSNTHRSRIAEYRKSGYFNAPLRVVTDN